MILESISIIILYKSLANTAITSYINIIIISISISIGNLSISISIRAKYKCK